MNPKKLLLVLTAIAAVAGVTIPATTDTCGYCNKAVYAYYQPIGYSRGGQSAYNWVISHHTTCRNNYYRRQSSSRSVYATRSRPSISIGFGTSPRYFGGYGGSYHSHSHRSYHGYRSYGRGGYCR